MLYGLMTEEINYSYDGGLYAELIRNRTFREDWSGVSDWYQVEKGTASVKMAVDEKNGPSAALSRSLRLEVVKADPANPAGILNTGYWGMAARPNTTYKGSFYAKHDQAGSSLPVNVALVNNQTGKVLANASILVSGGDWKQYEFSLKPGSIAATADNHFELTVDRPTTLWLQLVSLFPPTFHDRVNGNRIDLMEKLQAMHPAFLRFPGGNYLEGGTISDRFDWKKTIGPLVDRPTHPGTWSYHSSDGMGLLEFLEWCEDLKMQPLLAVYGGYSLGGQHVNTGTDLEPYIQDALDEIEYVTGDANTKWGAVRAHNGHPEPFTLHYVEIGNEDFADKSGSYDGRYAQFHEAIKKKYPQLQLIATAPVKGIKPDVIDDHYYLRATQMFHEASHYDKTDRNGPKIFIGEWATREGTPTPNLGAALGDAAWMTGLERNSDMIVMAAYAPLLVNVNPGGMQWDTDLIGYNAASSYGSPSYYAQAMFSSCLGEHTVESSLAKANDRFFYSVTATNGSGKVCIKVVNAASTPQPITIHLNGIDSQMRQAHVQTLSGPSTQSTNTIAEPIRLVPVKSSRPIAKGTLQYAVPAYAIQVLEVDLK